jgi:hypothetical protein
MKSIFWTTLLQYRGPNRRQAVARARGKARLQRLGRRMPPLHDPKALQTLFDDVTHLFASYRQPIDVAV